MDEVKTVNMSEHAFKGGLHSRAGSQKKARKSKENMPKAGVKSVKPGLKTWSKRDGKGKVGKRVV